MQYGKKGDYDLYFFYDNNDQPLGFYFKGRLTSGRKFYFVLNAQGDVVQIRDSANKAVANYYYDAWGKLLSITNTNGIEQTFTSDFFYPSNASIAYINPIRYRGYVYDNETGFYYLNTRYYDPSLRRFVNVDNQISEGGMFTGLNLFAYCGNNPVMRIDSNGEAWWHWAAAAAVVAVCAVAVVVTAGGAAAAIAAVAAVSSGMAASSVASTVAAAAFIGSATCLAFSAMDAAAESKSVKDFCNRGNWAMVATTTGAAIVGGGSAYLETRGSASSSSNYPPNNGFNSEPRESTILPGSQLQRSGDGNGRFVAPNHTPLESLSLPPDKIDAPMMHLEVLKPINVQAGTAVPWFGQPGGGTQFVLPDTIDNMVWEGYLKVLP